MISTWRIWLPQFLEMAEGCLNILSPEEQSRASKFFFEKDRLQFILTHWALRHILASILEVTPADLQFDQNPYGKPELHKPVTNGPIQFSLSHSGDVAIVTVSRGIEVGVDVEQINVEFNHEDITRQYFTSRESGYLQSISAGDRREIFYRIWTGKEAFIKAKGLGLSFPLDSFSMIPKLQDSRYLLEIESQPNEAKQWSITSFQPFPGYTAAVAAKAENVKFSYFQFHRDNG